jgi:hypothetical protein
MKTYTLYTARNEISDIWHGAKQARKMCRMNGTTLRAVKRSSKMHGATVRLVVK